MEIKKILWPTDFYENSNAALPYVLSLTKKYGAEIYLLYVAEDLAGYGTWYGELTPSHIEKLHEWEIPHAEKKMEVICQKDLAGCPLFQKRVTVGDPAEEILNTVDKEGVDVVVMATHGRGALNSIERICIGYQFKKVHEPVVARGEIDQEILFKCEELGKTIAAGCEARIY
jgi:nucleotide-binding universal stress UspA family protein